MKSHGSDQIELMECIVLDAFIRCAATSSALRDLMTIRSRVKLEGLSFLTITLPSFGKDFERSLDLGYVDSTLFRSFRKCGAIPAFLQGMLSLVFDRGTGRRLDDGEVSIPAIDSIRQCAYAFKKLEQDCTQERVQSSLDGFITVEHELSETRLRDCDVSDFASVALHVWSCLGSFSSALAVPKHGPGATAEHIIGNSKYVWQYWYDRLEPYFPLLDTAYTLSAYDSEEFHNVAIISEEQELPVRVTPVPKTQKGPRIIAIEPVCMQYAQQAIREYLYDTIESSWLSKGHVNFTDQSINRGLAMRASRDGLMATLDLSDASDRVKHDLAMRMFDGNPELRAAVEACRSTSALLPDGQIVTPLAKFASMGSALCFPVESMYFYTICVVALLAKLHLPVTDRNIFRVSRHVYVYGDDIIVPREHAATIVGYLQKYCCKVNVSKSHWNGKFRESCGMDAYDGIDVTPVYVHTMHPTGRRQARSLVSWVSSMNAFYKKGFMKTSSYIQKRCERYLGKLPIVTETCSGLGRVLDAPLTTERWNRKLQRAEISAWCASPVRCTDELGGYGALMKSLLSLARSPKDGIQAIDADHLERSVRRDAVTLKRRWCTAR